MHSKPSHLVPRLLVILPAALIFVTSFVMSAHPEQQDTEKPLVEQIPKPGSKTPLSSESAPQATSANANSAARPALLGRVLATNGLPHATVFITTAGPKVGTSTFCPSCYADCRKAPKRMLREISRSNPSILNFNFK